MKLKIRNSLIMFQIVLIGFLLISERDEVTVAVSNGLSVCGDVLIPSLFPFMVLSSFALSSELFDKNGKAVSFVIKKVFRLPAVCLPAVIFGFIGGYPVGAKVISRLYDEGKISGQDAKHLFSFCVNAGPAFAVSVAGKMMLGSKEAGYIILVSVCLASLMTGFIYGKIKKHREYTAFENSGHEVSFSESFFSAVSSSCNAMLNVCSWVLVFFAGSAIIRQCITNETAGLVYDSLSEVTSGLTAAAKLGGVPFVSACIAFGGVCIMCQLMPQIKKCGLKIREYLLFRIINSVLTFFICKTLLMFFDVTVSVYSNFKPAVHFAPASAALMIMCAVLISDIVNIRRSPYRS